MAYYEIIDNNNDCKVQQGKKVSFLEKNTILLTEESRLIICTYRNEKIGRKSISTSSKVCVTNKVIQIVNKAV